MDKFIDAFVSFSALKKLTVWAKYIFLNKIILAAILITKERLIRIE